MPKRNWTLIRKWQIFTKKINLNKNKMNFKIISIGMLVLAIGFTSCKKDETKVIENDTIAVNDSLMAPPPPPTVDSAAVNPTYSALKNGNISLEKDAIKLNSMTEGSTEKAYLLFYEDQSKAEVFMPGETKSLMMDRKGTEGDYTWTDGKYELIVWKGYVLQTLKQGNKLFAGDVEM